MNSKNIAKALKAKVSDWLKNIEDDSIKKEISENAIITGGALVSLLQGEQPNDYDVYFKTKESCEKVSRYPRKQLTFGTTQENYQQVG